MRTCVCVCVHTCICMWFLAPLFLVALGINGGFVPGLAFLVAQMVKNLPGGTWV